MNAVDMHSAEMLGHLADDLTPFGSRLQVVEAIALVRERLRREGVDTRLGTVNRFVSVVDAVESYLEKQKNGGK